MQLPSAGEIITVTTNSDVVQDKNYVFAEYDYFSVLCTVPSGTDLPIGSEIEVQVIPKGNLMKDLKCRYPVPQAKPARAAVTAETVKQEVALKGSIGADLRSHPETEAFLRETFKRGELEKGLGELVHSAVTMHRMLGVSVKA